MIARLKRQASRRKGLGSRQRWIYFEVKSIENRLSLSCRYACMEHLSHCFSQIYRMNRAIVNDAGDDIASRLFEQNGQ